MGEADYCDFCGAHISIRDFESGRAMTLMKKKFCKKCLEKAVNKSKNRPAGGKHNSTPSSTVSASL